MKRFLLALLVGVTLFVNRSASAVDTQSASVAKLYELRIYTASRGSESSGEAICRPCGVIIPGSRQVSM